MLIRKEFVFLTMKFGIVYPNSNFYVERKLIIDVAKTCDELDYDFLLTWDHYLTPNTRTTIDAWTLISFLSSVTTRIRLGTCVTPIPFRNPAQLAKVVASTDFLNEGRTILGVGAGWSVLEFEAFSVWHDDRTRVSMTLEGVQLIKRLWIEDRVDFQGKYYSTRGASIFPKPRQYPHPEIWFGGLGDRMISGATVLGTGWIPTMIDVDEYSILTKKIKSGLNGRRFSFAYNLYNPAKNAEDYIRKIEDFEDAGCEYFAVNWRYDPEEMVLNLKWFEKEVISTF
jgi:alkanesulfonate monooxygenase SsuD/methylene tetrahydromethanopterin reductase-like flavin-dependent oxidoreductase (luciferase family)